MAITTLFLTGFEHGFVAAAASAGGGLFGSTTAPTAGFSASTSSPRNGNYCAHLVSPANTPNRLFFDYAASGKVILRFAIKVSSRPSSGVADLASLVSAGTETAVLRITSAGVLQAGAVVTGFQNGPTIDTTNYHLVELQWDGVAKTIDWKVDGVLQSRATAATPTTTVQLLLGTNFANQPAFTVDYDDLIIGTWTVAATDWYGDGKVLTQLPGSDGAHATVTSLSPGDAGTAYSGTVTTANTMVDDPPGTGGWTATRSATDNIALRIATVGAYMEIKPAVTAEVSVANAVRAIMSYSSSATQANLAACDVRNVEGIVTELWGLTGGVGKAYNIIANQFKGGIVAKSTAGWTAAEINALRFRFGGCVSADINPVPTVQAMMLEVDWSFNLPTIYTDSRSGAATASGSSVEVYSPPTPYERTIYADNQVSYWRLDQTTVATDRKGVTNLPAINGPIATTAGIVKNNGDNPANVLVRASSQEFVIVGSAGLGTPYNTSTYSIEAWINQATSPSLGMVVYRPFSDQRLEMAVGRIPVFRARDGTNVQKSAQSAEAIPLGTTAHLVGVYDGTNLILYVNGVEKARTAMTGTQSSTDNAPVIGSTNGISFFDGTIDEVAWYGGVLSAERVLAHYKAGAPTVYDAVIDEDSPVSHWKMGNPNTLVDRKGIRNIPAINGPIGSVSSLVANNADDVASNLVRASSQEFLSSSPSGAYNASVWSIEAWIKTASVIVTQAIIHRHSGSEALVVSSSGIRVEMSDGTVIVSVQSGSLLVVGQTYHIVGVYDGTKLMLYVNGVKAGTDLSVATRDSSGNDQGPHIGSYDGVSFFDGAIDEVAWYSTVLSPARILAHYQIGSPGDSMSGTAIASGATIESYSHDASVSGTITASGTGVEVYVPPIIYTDTVTGTITASGTGVDKRIYADDATYYDNVIDVDSPTSHWKLGNPSTAVDRRGLLDLPAVSGPIATAAGIVVNNGIGLANVFVGTVNARFDAGSATGRGLPYAGVYSMEAWVTPTGDFDGLVMAVGPGTSLRLRSVGLGTQVSTEFAFEDSAGSQFSIITLSANRLIVGQSYHIVGIYDGITAILYVNGVEVRRTTSVGVGGVRLTPNTPPFISGSILGSWPRVVVDEVAWYPTALSAARVLAHYNAGVASGYDATIDADSPVSHWKLGETGQATDRKGVQNLLAVSNPSTAESLIVNNGSNIASAFDGVNSPAIAQRFSVPQAANIGLPYNTTAWSAEVWIKPSSFEISPDVLRRVGSVYVWINTDGDVVWGWGTGSSTSGRLILNRVAHLVITFDGTTGRGYIDGKNVATQATGAVSVTDRAPIIGARSESTSLNGMFRGIIDEVAYYNTALSPEHILSHYRTGLRFEIGSNGTGVESWVYDDSGSGTVTASGSGVEDYQPPVVGVVYDDNATGGATSLGTSIESAVITDVASGTIISSGISTESAVITDISSGTVTTSGASTESAVITDVASGTVTVSGTRTESATIIDVALGTITSSGTTSESSAHTGSGTGTIITSGTGIDSRVYTDTSTGTIAATGSGIDTRVYIDISTGTIVDTGTGTDSGVYTDSSIGTTLVSGTGTDTSAYTDTSTGTIVVTGTGIDGIVHTGSGICTGIASGTGTELALYVDSVTGTTIGVGTSIESAVHSSSATGTFVANGTGIDSRVYDDAGSGTALISGTGVETHDLLIGYIDAGSGQINASGTGVESQSHTSTAIGSVLADGTRVESQSRTSTAIGSVLADGTSVESQSHTNTAIGSLLADGTSVESQSHTSTAIGSVLADGTSIESGSYTNTAIGSLLADGESVESQSHTSTAIGFLVVDGTASETYQIIYPDISDGTVISTGTGVESISYSYAATGTIISTGESVDEVSYSNTVTGTTTLLGSGVEGYSYTDIATGFAVFTGIGHEVASYTQPIPFSTVVALNRFHVEVWNKTSIRSVVTNTAPLTVHIALHRGTKVDVTKRNGMKILVTNR